MLYFSPWKIAAILLVLVVGLLLAAPSALPASVRDALPGWLPANTIKLGLDLQGGAHLLYEVDLGQVTGAKLDSAAADARAALRTAQIQTRSLEVVDGAVVAALVDPSQTAAALAALEPLAEPIDANAVLGGGAQTLAIVSPSDGIIRLEVTPEALEDIRARTLSQSIEVIRRRVDGTGTTEPTIQRQGEDRILVQAPGVGDPQRLKDAIGTTAKMTFHLVATEDAAQIQAAVSAGRAPPNQLLLPGDDEREPYVLVQRLAVLSGDDLRRSSQGFHPENGEPIVNFQFDTNGARVFCDLTSRNLNRRFAVVLDGVVITAPNIRSPICGGSGFIEGGFTVESASDLAALLNAGALPADLTIVEERTVGAELGRDSVRAGSIAIAVGFLAVVVFMLVAYGLFGVFANLALLANVVLIAAALSLLQATLTLPGIAGIILVIGMAVDANVLIFERIREELKNGRTPANAIETGFGRALTTILDANITTIIAAIILFYLGSGPVRGFAVTLGIGIITSVFTAFMVTRLLVAVWFRAVRPKSLAF